MNARELLGEYGSPAYVYDLGEVRTSLAMLRGALPHGSVVYYSLKANPHPALVRELVRLGCRAEVCSPGELATALAAGARPGDVLYTGPGKSRAEVRNALSRGVTHFSVDSADDVAKVAELAEEAGVRVGLLLRINPDRPVPGLGLTMCGGPSQFGADAAAVLGDPAAFRGTPWARVTGCHVYMGTNITETETLLATFRTALELAVEVCAAVGVEPEIVDLGGGFGHPFAHPGPRHDFAALRGPLEALLDERLPGWREGRTEVAFESGRYLVAASGSLLATVEDVKTSKDRPFVVLDTGIHHLGGMSGLRRVPSVAAGALAEEDSGETLDRATLVGPLCTPLDYLARETELPAVRRGDPVRIPNVGAYGLTASLVAFLSRDPPVEIVLDGGEVVDASRLCIARHAAERRHSHTPRSIFA